MFVQLSNLCLHDIRGKLDTKTINMLAAASRTLNYDTHLSTKCNCVLVCEVLIPP